MAVVGKLGAVSDFSLPGLSGVFARVQRKGVCWHAPRRWRCSREQAAFRWLTGAWGAANAEACFFSFPSPGERVSLKTTASLKPPPPQVLLVGGW